MLKIDRYTACWKWICIRHVENRLVYGMLKIDWYTACWKSIGIRHVDRKGEREYSMLTRIQHVERSHRNEFMLAHAVFHWFSCRNLFNMPKFKFYRRWKFYSKLHVSSHPWTNGMLNFKQHVENTACWDRYTYLSSTQFPNIQNGMLKAKDEKTAGSVHTACSKYSMFR